ncbi:hypothetical protein GCM10009087_21050 [Sphingomonas oligophenolica]|uniref:DUF4129 domain-containing protein n=1 Tax=Sphingomonas oligophenolica TaxID=301154 RepID=A0ABU9Y3V0_9SPHN
MLLQSLLAIAQVAAPSAEMPSSPPATARALSCLPAGITRGAKVVALSVYSSSTGQTLPFLLAGSNNNAVHTLTVTGHGSGPVVLVVAAYEPILWDLSAVRDRVKAVVASGYYPQAVRGVPSDIPVRFASSVGTFNGSETCARIHYAYDDSAEIQTMAGDTRRAIGVYPRIFYGTYNADRLDMDGPGTAAPRAPDFSDIRASVPLITEDDPSSRARMKMIPAVDERSSGGPRLRIVEWNDAGKIVRDEGGRAPAVTNAARAPSGASELSEPTEQRGGGGLTLLKWLAYIGVIIFAGWQWRRSRKKVADRPAPDQPRPARAPDAQPSGQPIAAASSRFQKRVAELSELAAITDCEPLVVALHRYGREVQNLSRTRFDPDLADEIGAIVESHFEHAIERYRQVRTSLSGTEGERADAMLTRAIERLALRLQELQAEQHHRDVDGVDEAARFIDARHPV